MSRRGVLDEAVGEQHAARRRARWSRARTSNSASSSSPRTGPVGVRAPTSAGRRRAATRAGGWPALRSSKSPVARSRCRWIAVANPSRPVLAEQVVVGRGQELSRASGGSMPLNAPERNSDRVPASTPLPETSTTTRSRHSSETSASATMKSPANERAAGRPRHRLRVPLSGQRRRSPCLRDAVAQVDEHRLAVRPGDAEPAPAERHQEDQEARCANVTTTGSTCRGSTAAGRAGAPPRRTRATDDEPRQRPRPQPQAADEHREQQRAVAARSRGTSNPAMVSSTHRQHRGAAAPGVSVDHLPAGCRVHQPLEDMDRRPPSCRSGKALTSGFSARRDGGTGRLFEPSSARLDIGTRPRAERGLATRAPEQVASLEHLGAHRRAADQARLSVAPVDVDLAPVVVDAAAAGPSPPACAPGARCRSCRCARPRASARRGRPTSPGTGRRRSVRPGRSGWIRCRNSTSAR